MYSMSKEDRDSLQDPGPYYIYEDGELTLQTTSLGPKRSKKCIRLSSITAKKPAASHVDTFDQVLDFTHLLSSGQDGPPSLMKICLHFVAKNITLVESLEGFPDVMGKVLFDMCVEVNQFRLYNQRSCEAMQLFCDAYGDLVLDGLTLAGRPDLVSIQPNLVTLFPSLRKLDLSGCKLGSCHPLLVYIAQLDSLCELSLQDNSLDDETLQRLTTPLRMYQMKSGPYKLTYLNLASNPKVTDCSVRYIHHFKLLQLLDVSGTKVSERGCQQLQDFGLTRVAEDDSSFTPPSCTSKAWAINVVSNWLTQSQVASQNKAAKFYGTSRIDAGKNTISKCRMRGTDVPSPTRLPHMLFAKDKTTQQTHADDVVGKLTKDSLLEQRRLPGYMKKQSFPKPIPLKEVVAHINCESTQVGKRNFDGSTIQDVKSSKTYVENTSAFYTASDRGLEGEDYDILQGYLSSGNEAQLVTVKTSSRGSDLLDLL